MTEKLSIYKGGSKFKGVEQGPLDWDEETKSKFRKDVADAMNAKHLSFLLGSGCSSDYDQEQKQVGIPTMQSLARGFMEDATSPHGITSEVRKQLLQVIGLDIDSSEYQSNLEALMEVLYSYTTSLAASKKDESPAALALVKGVIDQIKLYIFKACTDGAFAYGDLTVLRTYERFFRSLVQRDRALPRPWVFTTNYDLFCETAMDRLGIAYINGFLGSIERRFNPAVFRYTLAEQLDLMSRKWNSVDSLVYFAKLHGSVSWESRGGGLFPVVETSPKLLKTEGLLIYPTPAKQNASFASPYSDMFREFQSRVVREQSVLFVLGYSFGDEHVNNIIFQALTIPTFRVVIFADPNANEMISMLRELDDPRIWIVGTEEKNASWKSHYFSTFVKEIMIGVINDPSESAVQRIIDTIFTQVESDVQSE